jgi:hypothetical protein
MQIIWTMQNLKLVDILGVKRGTIWKLKLSNLKQPLKTRTSVNFIAASAIWKKVTSLKSNTVKDVLGDVVVKSDRTFE